MRILFAACLLWTVFIFRKIKGDCSYELGMQSKGILDGSISVSSTLSADHVPGFARLDEPQGAWCSATNDNSPYVQIQLSEEKLITKMMTQGSLKDLRWSMEYQIKYLKEGKWITYQKADGGLTLEGNRNVQSLKEHVLQPPIRTSSIRIYPMAPESVMPNMTLDKVSCLRLELYGCSATGETRKCFGRICSGTSNQISGQDAYNSGAWGAPRGNGTHRGIDIVCSVGSEVYAPFPAEVIREAKLYGSGHRLYKEPFNTGIYLQGTGEWNVYKVVLFYMRKEVSNGTKVSEGSYIGRMLNRAAGRPGMTNVIHVDLYKNGKRVNPTPYVC